MAAKKAVGENINIPEDRFTQRLKGNEQALVKKHGVQAVSASWCRRAAPR